MIVGVLLGAAGEVSGGGVAEAPCGQRVNQTRQAEDVFISEVLIDNGLNSTSMESQRMISTRASAFG